MDACLQLRCLASHILELRAFARRGPHRKYSFSSFVASIRVAVACNALIKSVTVYYEAVRIPSEFADRPEDPLLRLDFPDFFRSFGYNTS